VKRRILVIDGHPDARAGRFVHALATAYAEGARAAGHEVQSVSVAELDFPLLRTADEFERGALPPALRESQARIAWCEHLVLLYPLWLGSTPALLKGFLEQALRPGFAIGARGRQDGPARLLKGKSARIILTMGMPALFYRWYYRAHSLKSLERNILAFCGFAPIRASIFGMVDSVDSARRGRWLLKVQALGRASR